MGTDKYGEVRNQREYGVASSIKAAKNRLPAYAANCGIGRHANALYAPHERLLHYTVCSVHIRNHPYNMAVYTPFLQRAVQYGWVRISTERYGTSVSMARQAVLRRQCLSVLSVQVCSSPLMSVAAIYRIARVCGEYSKRYSVASQVEAARTNPLLPLVTVAAIYRIARVCGEMAL